MEPDPDVLEMVRRQLDRDSPPSTEALYGRAARINGDIYELSLRQFNATYVLRVKRERKRAEEEDRSGGSGGSGTGSGGAGGGEAAPTEESGEVEPRPGGFLDALRDEEEGGEEAGGGEDDPAASEATAAPSPGGPGGAGDEGAPAGLRARVRSVLWRHARRVAARPGMAGALEAVETVDERVEEILRLARGGAGAASDA